VSRNYVTLKRELEATNQVNQAKLDVETKAHAEANADTKAEQEKHVAERETLLTKVDQLQTENGKQAAEIASLNTKFRELQEDSTKRIALANQIIRELKDFKESKETVLDHPDGRLTYVDYGRGEVRTDLVRSQGAKPQMKFTIFDRNAPGIPTEKPKGTIELVYVGDSYSIGRIVKTFDNLQPFRTGDIVHSISWSPNEPTRFALIGKIDINRDGKDDRSDLKRMIEATGGIVDYDLPPPEVGKETGEVSARDAWYVTDDRMPFTFSNASSKSVTATENAEFLTKKSAAIRKARLDGVRPMELGRLLTMLGYDFAAPVVGRAEAVNRNTLNQMLRPRGNQVRPPATAPAPEENATPKEEAPPAEEPK